MCGRFTDMDTWEGIAPRDVQRARRDGGREAVLPRVVPAPALPDPGVGLLRVALRRTGEQEEAASLVLHRARRRADPHHRGPVGRMDRPGERRDDPLVHDDHHRAERVRGASARPHAGAAAAGSVRRLARRLGRQGDAGAGSGRHAEQGAGVATGELVESAE